MNRKDRRAQRAKERKARRLPKGYYDDVERAAKLIFDWVQAQPAPPDLRWLPQKDDGVFLISALDAGAQYLADSPDAFALLAWLDEKTERKLSLNQAIWALRRCRALPMPDGSYWGVTEVRQSNGYKALMRSAEAVLRGDQTQRVPESTCPHCGQKLDGATSAEGDRAPKPGDFTVCWYCGGINTIDVVLGLVKMTEPELEALGAEHPDALAQLREMQALVRRALLSRGQAKKGPVAEA